MRRLVKQDYMLLKTPLGWVGVGWTVSGLWSSSLPMGNPADVLSRLEKYGELGQEKDFPAIRRDLEKYFAGERVDFTHHPVDWGGCTPFRRDVLRVTAAIPHGEVRTYRDLARAVGNPGAGRAVGGVMAYNPLPLIIPCHRVVRSDGSLGGFAGGLVLKARLLELEGIELPMALCKGK
ncbi:MAG: methylated-DNA--[protein]-cysteine S-methyltransferase [Firmicutes bacterium]|nr:methylated-DNA--[protein]-cysteine S-methyltransferase [Bacillota bacterium]